MLRYIALAAALLLARAAHATLVVAVPSRDGLVIAADSRLTFMGAECDGAFKILVPRQPARTVAVITGDSIFVAPPPEGENPCHYLASAPRLLDMNAVVSAYLERAGRDPAGIDLETLAGACVGAVERFRSEHPSALRGYEGRALFSVLVASYDPAAHTSTLRNFVISLDAVTGRAQAARVSTTSIEPRHARGVWAYGETAWVNRNVYRGVGRGFLTPSTMAFLHARLAVSATSTQDAEAAAANLIEAARRAAQLDPPPSGIGGPVRLVVLGSSAHPQVLAGNAEN